MIRTFSQSARCSVLQPSTHSVELNTCRPGTVTLLCLELQRADEFTQLPLEILHQRVDLRRGREGTSDPFVRQYVMHTLGKPHTNSFST